MGEKKVVGRTVVITLGIICVILAVGLVGAIANYTSIISGKDKTIASLNSQMGNLQNQINALKAELETIKAPKLVGTINAVDNRPWLRTSYLHVEGFICNVGNYPASDAKLYVQAFQKDVLAINTFILMGTIGAEGIHYVKSDITYTGDKLTKCHIWSEPAAIDWWWHYT